MNGFARSWRSRIARMALGIVIVASPAVAGGGAETLTPGWDGFPGLTSGAVDWSIAAGTTTLEVTFTLDGATASHERQAGLHHFDVVGRPELGSTTIETGSGAPAEETREGRTSVISSDEFGFVTTDGNGDATAPFTLVGVNPGLYAAQFHLRAGGAPGCPTTSCNADYRTGGAFADDLVRFAVPGAVALWSGDDDDANDELGDAEALWSGTPAYRAGNFRDGFELGGGAYLSVPDPATHGLDATSGFTVAAWIESDQLVSTAAIVNLRTPANSSGFTLEHLFQTPGSISFSVNTTGGAEEFTTLVASGFPAATRTHVAATFEAANHRLRLFRDGALVAERSDAPGSNLSLNGAESFELGRNIVNGALFDGLVDDLLYFAEALPPGTISALAFPGGLLSDGFESGSTVAWSTTVAGD